MSRSPKRYCPNCRGTGIIEPTFGDTRRCACTLDDREFDKAVDEILGADNGDPTRFGTFPRIGARVMPDR